MDLWVDKHRPGRMDGIIGQSKGIQEMTDFIGGWEPGKAMLIHGPTGVGKSLAVGLLARERKHLLLQLNASDARSSGDIEDFLGNSSRSR